MLEYFRGYRSIGNFPLYKAIKKHFLKPVVLCDLEKKIKFFFSKIDDFLTFLFPDFTPKIEKFSNF